MRNLIFLFALLTSFTAAHAANVLTLAYGPSIAADPANKSLASKKGPSRSNGGEKFVMKINSPKQISSIKITGFSASGAGKVVIRGATGINGANKVSLEELTVFAKVKAGNPTDYQKAVMLAAGQWVETLPNQAFAQMEFTAEGFSNDDTSMQIEITSNDVLAPEDYLVTRTSSNETFGGMINESTFAKFTIDQLQALMGRGHNPNPAELNGVTFTCSSWTKLNAAKISFKKRTYSNPAPGVLISESAAQNGQLNWAPNALGTGATIQNFNGCGKFTTLNMLRVTGAGNLIAEITLNLDAYINLCAAAGYDPVATRAVETNSTFQSVFGPTYVADGYEFCTRSP